MAVRSVCSKCNKENEPYIDKKTDKVFCDQCREEIQVNHFMKVQLKSLKQYAVKKTSVFGVKCTSCNAEDTPKEVNGKFACGTCSKELKNLSEPFKVMLRLNLAKVGKDIIK
jgi:DNA-directed RNA polymerase subunit RPC12/RpoP